MVRSSSFLCVYICFFFFFKQKTAYEKRISDWSSDVCSSDLYDIGNTSRNSGYANGGDGGDGGLAVGGFAFGGDGDGGDGGDGGDAGALSARGGDSDRKSVV